MSQHEAKPQVRQQAEILAQRRCAHRASGGAFRSAIAVYGQKL